MKVECLSSKLVDIKIVVFEEFCLACASDPPVTPSTAASDWDSSTKTIGTVVTYTCPDTTETKTVCDAETLAWIPATIPVC